MVIRSLFADVGPQCVLCKDRKGWMLASFVFSDITFGAEDAYKGSRFRCAFAVCTGCCRDCLY